MARNFIPGPNPFSIAEPPAWFLTDLLRFDPALVLFASQEQPCYQIARRMVGTRQARPSEKHPDTAVFATHNLHPVGRLLPAPFTRWGPTILADLRARDVDAVGGGDKAADRLDSFDHEQEQQFELELHNHLDYVTADAWRYKTTTHFTRRRTRTESKRSVPSIKKPNFKPGGSAVFVGDRHLKRVPPKVVADVFL